MEKAFNKLIIGTERKNVLIFDGEKNRVIDASYPLIASDSDDKVYIYSSRGALYDLEADKQIEDNKIKNMNFMEVTGNVFDKRIHLGCDNELLTLDRKFKVYREEKLDSEITGITKIDNEILVFLKDGKARLYSGTTPVELKVDDKIRKVFGKDGDIYILGNQGVYEFNADTGFKSIIRTDGPQIITGITKTDYGTIMTTPGSIHNYKEGIFEDIFISFATTGEGIRFVDSRDNHVCFGLENCRFYMSDAKDLTAHMYTHDKFRMSKGLDEFPETFKKIFSAKKAIGAYTTEKLYYSAKII